ncbi:hypothetical protein IV203_014424 [Nitzschia inconspicua]|uniref:Uncharacterized protein n=1 Tax=Nitzschia inconspicua TaxID=303405 RepID=A0A9K3PSC7_9STRA|nr:hypothetical protein IV203_014424 [Nitzschia inconspicua]
MQMAEFRRCPVKTNGNDCGLFALAVVWFLLCDKDIRPSVFTQAHIDTFPIEISPPSFASVGDVQLAERNTDAGPGMEFGPTEEPGQEQDPILDYEDNYFQENFSSKGVVCGTVDDVVVAINEYQESSGNVLSTVRTRGNARTFVCISHANCPFSVKFGPMPKQEGIFYKGSGLRRRWSKVFRPPDH